ERQEHGGGAPGRGRRVDRAAVDHHQGAERRRARRHRRGDEARPGRAGAHRAGTGAGTEATGWAGSAAAEQEVGPHTMFSRFFIDRPIFAAVLSIFIALAGLAAMRTLPIAQYPEIAPPVVTVQAIYPGASAETMAETVAAPLENQITGVEKMIYMDSTSGSNGITQIQVTFDIGADPDQAALN